MSRSNTIQVCRYNSVTFETGLISSVGRASDSKSESRQFKPGIGQSF